MRNAAIAIYLAVCLGSAMAAESPKAPAKAAKSVQAPPMEQVIVPHRA